MRLANLLSGVCLMSAAIPCLAGQPLILGHRGAAGHLPEHTRSGYILAVAMGADFIEPDLVITRDGELVVRHENNITDTTDVAQKFPERRTRKVVDGKAIDGWFTEDFTLAEIKTLRARERLPFRNHAHDGRDQVLTLQEVIDIAKRASAEFGRTIGIYPETKHPSYFRSIGLPLEEKLVATLKANGYDAPDAPCFIQSFEYGNLQAIRAMISTPTIFLMEAAHRRPHDFVLAGDPRTYGDLTRPEELEKIARFATGIGPSKRLIVPEKGDRTLAAPTSLVADAHRAGLLVHPYTFRDDPVFLAPDYVNDPQAEYLQFFRLGVDAVFSDFPDSAFRARARFLHDTRATP